MSSLRNFFWLEFADFYIEEVKYRVYGENSKSKENAKATLLYVFSEMVKCFSPFVPHTTEEIWQTMFKKLHNEKSIHLEKWPKARLELLDEKCSNAGELAKQIIAMIRKQKSDLKIAINAPLQEFKLNKQIDNNLFELVEEDIKRTMNVEKIVLMS